ncbi:MAG: ClbS/DfsB family four-helix bundle protein [Octadecabacter sp.]
MPAATNRADLLAVTQKNYAKLRALIDTMPYAQAKLKREDGTSIKDVVGHRADWQVGNAAEIPAPGYKWNQPKAYNADLCAAQSDLDWNDARDMLAVSHPRLGRGHRVITLPFSSQMGAHLLSRRRRLILRFAIGALWRIRSL